MHDSCRTFAESMIRDARGKRVLEIGASDVNGSIREYVCRQNPKIYIGTDIEKHPVYGWPVDLVIPAAELCDYFKDGTFDIIICLNTLEHIEDWRISIFNIDQLLSYGGYTVISAPSPGFPYHEYPIDRWRFTVDDMNEIFKDYDVMAEADPEVPGVLVKATKLEKRYSMETGFKMPITLARLKTINVREVMKP